MAKGAKQAKRAEAGPSGGEASVLSFSEAAQCEEKYEVCRMFLAALQLTNHGNIDLVKEGSIDDGNMSLSIHLLDANKRIDFTSAEAQTLLK